MELKEHSREWRSATLYENTKKGARQAVNKDCETRKCEEHTYGQYQK